MIYNNYILKVVREKYENHKEGMEILSLNENDLINTVPTGSAVQESNAVIQLRKLMEDVCVLYIMLFLIIFLNYLYQYWFFSKVETIKTERDVIESELKSATTDMKTTFLSALAKDGGIDEPNLSIESIGKTYGPLQKQVRDSVSHQEQLIAEIQVIFILY